MFGVKERKSVDKAANILKGAPSIGLVERTKSILIVDEDNDVLNQLAESLAICAKQYNIYTARNGRDALRILKTSSVNILLTIPDIPVMHDFELVGYTKFYYPATQLFVMSEEDSSAIKEKLSDTTINGFIRKPFRIETIYCTLRV